MPALPRERGVAVVRFRNRYGGVTVDGRDGQDVTVITSGWVGAEHGQLIRFADGHVAYARDDELEAS